jgi:hypothetical protein
MPIILNYSIEKMNESIEWRIALRLHDKHSRLMISFYFFDSDLLRP